MSHYIIACHNCKRALCADGQPHFPSHVIASDQRLRLMSLLPDTAVAFPETVGGKEFMDLYGWKGIGGKHFCPDCGSDSAQRFLNDPSSLTMMHKSWAEIEKLPVNGGPM